MGKLDDLRRKAAASLRESCEAGIDAVLSDPLVLAADGLLDEVGAALFSRDTGDPLSYVRDQVLRSCGSVGANVCEGIGRGAARDRRRFWCIARGSAYETVFWLRALGEEFQAAQARSVEMCRMLDRAIMALIDTDGIDQEPTD